MNPLILKLAAIDADEDSEVEELQVAEYIVFLLALDTYMRYVEDLAGEGHEDDVQRSGVKILRLAENLTSEGIKTLLGGSLKAAAQKSMLAKAMSLKPTAAGATKRAFLLRTLLSRGGATTMRAVFEGNKARAAVKSAISASMVDDADAALDKFAAIPILNLRVRNWIDLAVTAVD